MNCELVRSPAPRRPLCWRCARLTIRGIWVAGRPETSYSCGWNPIRAPDVDRCDFYMREIGADDDVQPRGRWLVVGVAH
jgi:hypothetical protein